MKKVINEKLIKRNKTIGNVTSIVGMVILGGGLVLSLNQDPDSTRTLFSFVALIVGFIIAQVSTYYVSRFSRSPRFDEIIAENLSKLNNQYTFYVYSSPVAMVLVGPSGIWVPIPILASGEIYYDKKWKQRGGSFFLKIFGQENVGKPGLDVQTNEREIYSLLNNHFEKDEMPPVNCVLVSMHPKAIIGDVENAPNPIVEAEALRRLIRKNDRKSEDDIPQDVVNKLNELFVG